MRCPNCKSEDHIVVSLYQTVDTKADEFRRVRKCNNCHLTFATKETYSKKTLEEVENEKRNAI